MRAVVLTARFLFSANYLKVCYNKPYKTKTEDIMDYSQILSQQFNIKEEYAKNIITLLDDGNTILLLHDTERKCTVQWMTS